MLRRFCLHVRVHALHHQKGIWLPILYHELNRDDTILVQGWVKGIEEESGGSWHLWCESAGGMRVDPHVTLLDMDDIFYKLMYLSEKPENSEEDEETVKQWETYEEDPQEFWKTQSQEIKSFRSKMFALIKKKKF